MKSTFKNRIRPIIVVTCISILPFNFVFSQTNNTLENYKKFDEQYGLDPFLYNGRKYYREHPNATGHPYYLQENTFEASLTKLGKTFQSVQLKYEINKQYFILVYNDYHGAQQMLILNSSSIDSVNLNNQLFVKNNYSEIKTPFIQQIYIDRISAYISHKKEYEFQRVGTQTGYKYLKQTKTNYLVISDTVFSFKSKNSFIKIFDKKHKKILKNYISDNHIKFRKINDLQLKELIIFCNATIE